MALHKMANVNDNIGEVESKECVNLLYLASTQGETCDPVMLLEQVEAKGIPISSDINVGGDKNSRNTPESGYSYQPQPQAQLPACDSDSKVDESTNATQSGVTNTQSDPSNRRGAESDVFMNRKERVSCEEEHATKRVCPRVNCPEKIVCIVTGYDSRIYTIM